MKKLLILLLTFFALNSCEKDADIIGVDAEKKLPKVDVCHKGEIINISENALKAHLIHGDVQLIDEDGDGYVTLENECLPYGDCDDTNANINPGAEEICGDGIDNNCDGEVDEGCDVELAIGDVHEGGLIFYIDETGEHGLVAGPALNYPIWDCLNITTGADRTDVGSGAQNTNLIMEFGCSRPWTAVEGCSSFIWKGYDDWFLPSKDELSLIYSNLFLTGIVEYQTILPFWSSSEVTDTSVWALHFSVNIWSNLWKGNQGGSVPVRAF